MRGEADFFWDRLKLMCKQEVKAPGVLGFWVPPWLVSLFRNSYLEVNLIIPSYPKECEQSVVGFALQLLTD